MTVFCGPSGSGKSSLAMDTIYAEGQRRYVESLSAYARQFVSQMQKPRVDHIDGLSPAIAIEQKNLGHTPRSTVGTVTEIYDYLRILLARLGTLYCPTCDIPVGTQTTDEITAKIMQYPEGSRLYLLAPVDVAVGQDYASVWRDLQASGYQRVRIDGTTHDLDHPPTIDRRRKHKVEVIVDRAVVKTSSRRRIAESVEQGVALGKGVLQVARENPELPETQWEVVRHSVHLACDQCGRSFEPLSPHHFSFNSSLGWCPTCEGLGTQMGANPAALLQDPKLALQEGAVALWPHVTLSLSQRMLRALSAGAGLPVDVPFEQLSARHRRMVMHGCGDQWFDVFVGDKPTDGNSSGRLFQFQYKGLYPALEEASRLSPSLRGRLDFLIDEVECSVCGGSRLRDDAASARFQGRTIDELCRLPLGQLQEELRQWKLLPRDRKIAGELLREVKNRVEFLNDVGLHYLTLARGAATLSNGEAQRIRLASQLGSGLCGVLYVLDEPTIGLHPRDNRLLLNALHKLRDLGNTLIVVEHDREVIEGSDYVCDFGPAAGKLGGEIVAQGTPRQLARRATSLTGPYLSGAKSIPIPANRRMVTVRPAGETSEKPRRRTDRARKATASPTASSPRVSVGLADRSMVGGDRCSPQQLAECDRAFPLGTLTAVSGPSGSGKSSLLDDVLYAALARRLHRASVIPGAHDELRGVEYINKVIRVDQQALGNSPTSNPATYTGVFDLIRLLFAQLPESKFAGIPRGSASTCPADAATAAKGMGNSVSRCTSCRMCGSNAIRVVGSDTTPKRSP